MAATSATTIVQPTFPTASLYVGDLAPDVTETILFETFNKIGTVVSVRVCRDNITKRSLGYAYVNYLQQPDAERALETLNNSLIKNRPCRIMWSQRDPSIRKSGKANIYIKNLEKKITHKELYDTFVQFGSITSCKIALDEKNESKGFGFIQFVNPESADAAITQVNGMLIEGKKVFVGHFVPQKDRQVSATTRKFTNMYVKDLPPTISSDAKLKELFTPYGEVLSAVLMMDLQNKPKGFGFVNVATPEQAIAAVEGLNGKKLEGAEKPLYVSRAQKKAERQYELKNKFEQMKMEQSTKYQGVNLYVKNLEDDVNSDKLRQLFAPFGNISNAVVMEDEVTHASKGFGFVCFSTPEEATKAVTEMNSKMVGNKPLYVSLAQRKDIRKAQLEAQFAQRKQMQAQARLGGPGAPMYNPQLLGPQHPMAPTGQFNFPFANPNAALVPNSFANSGANANANAASYPGWQVNQNQGGRGRGGYGYPMPGYGMPYPYPTPNIPTQNPNNPLNNNNNNNNNNNSGLNNNNNNNALNNANAMGGMNPNANRGKARGGMGGPNNMGRGGVKRSFPPNNMNPMNPMNPMNNLNPNPNPSAVVQNMPATVAVVTPQTNTAVEAPLTLQTLAAYSPDDQKRLLGDQLYPRIEAINAENAGKITGMILEGSTNEEMLNMLGNDSALLSKVHEALEVLKSS